MSQGRARATGDFGFQLDEVMSVMTNVDLSDLIDQVPPGGGVVYERSSNEKISEQRFVVATRNFEYSNPEFSWRNEPPHNEMPRAPGRSQQGRTIEGSAKCDLTFAGRIDQLADFYSIAHGPFFISQRLLDLILEMDEGAIEYRMEEVRTSDGVETFFLVVPSRVLDKIDLDRTTVRVYDDNLAGTHIRRVKFPDGMIFSEDIPAAVHLFWDRYSRDWLWSREFVRTCARANVRGISTQKTDVRDPGEVFYL